jgi:hypothetical protein
MPLRILLYSLFTTMSIHQTQPDAESDHEDCISKRRYHFSRAAAQYEIREPGNQPYPGKHEREQAHPEREFTPDYRDGHEGHGHQDEEACGYVLVENAIGYGKNPNADDAGARCHEDVTGQVVLAEFPGEYYGEDPSQDQSGIEEDSGFSDSEFAQPVLIEIKPGSLGDCEDNEQESYERAYETAQTGKLPQRIVHDNI